VERGDLERESGRPLNNCGVDPDWIGSIDMRYVHLSGVPMTDDKYGRYVELACPTCGGTQFEHGSDIENDTAQVRCIGCDRTFSKDELIAANAENIDGHVREVGSEIIKDLKKDLGRLFNRGFPK
jgi:hypothetical protein